MDYMLSLSLQTFVVVIIVISFLFVCFFGTYPDHLLPFCQNHWGKFLY